MDLRLLITEVSARVLDMENRFRLPRRRSLLFVMCHCIAARRSGRSRSLSYRRTNPPLQYSELCGFRQL